MQRNKGIFTQPTDRDVIREGKIASKAKEKRRLRAAALPVIGHGNTELFGFVASSSSALAKLRAAMKSLLSITAEVR